MRQPLHRWLAGLFLLVLLLLVWWLAPDIEGLQALWRSINDQAQLQAFVDRLGWMGPMFVILLNALQIVVAPVPGYIIQLASGFLYGTFWGGLWGATGLFLGAMTAMKLARLYGRPLVQKLVGAGRLAKWEQVTHSENPLLWCVLLVGPTGDLPYHLAGLSRVSFLLIAVITLCVRVPSAFVAAAVGAGTVTLSWWQFALFLAILGLLSFIFLRYQTQLTGWFDQQVQQRLFREKEVDKPAQLP